MPNAAPSMKKLAALTEGIHQYESANAAAKETLHNSGKAFLRALAGDLGLEKGDYEVRSNKGGVAVSGEVTLHSDKIYVQLAEHVFGGKGGVSVLYRNCAGREDYSGGQNHNIHMTQLAEGAYPGFVAKCQTLMEQAPAPRVTARPR